MMAAGKSTIGKMVAKKQKLEFFDTDLVIEKKHSMKIKDIFSKRGEKFFRNEEEKEVLQLLKKNNCIITLGGGAFVNNTIRSSVLKNSISILLEANLKTLSKRIKWNKKSMSNILVFVSDCISKLTLKLCLCPNSSYK